MHFIIDFPSQGIGDVVMGCWILNSIQGTPYEGWLKLNPRRHQIIPQLLSIDQAHITDESGVDFSSTAELGHQFEFKQVANNSSHKSRFQYWCNSLKLENIEPQRPSYVISEEDLQWAREEWSKIVAGEARKKILLFPATAWLVRQWPKAYFMDLVNLLKSQGYAVAAMGSTEEEVKDMNCNWYYGFGLSRVAAMITVSDYVIGCDSGPAHLAGTLQTKTLALCGPTRGEIVFGHDPYVDAITFDPSLLACVGCHFSASKGYRLACAKGGCQALMRLLPNAVLRRVERALEPTLAMN